MIYTMDDLRRFFQLTSADEQKKILIAGEAVDVPKRSNITVASYALPYDEFELALGVNLLSTLETIEAIEKRLLALMQIAEEVRIYPLDAKSCASAEWVAPILVKLQASNYGVELKQVSVDAENKQPMLRIWANECAVS